MRRIATLVIAAPLVAAAFVLAPTASAEDFGTSGDRLPYTFSLDAPAAGYVTVSIARAPDGFTPTLSVLAPKGAVVAPEALEARVPAGRVRMQLADRYGATPAGAIRFTARFTRETDPSEPNDVARRARPVRLGAPFALGVMPRGDKDWLAVDLSEPGYLLLEAPGAPEGLELAATFHDGPIDLPTSEGVARAEFAGRVRVEVGDADGSFSSPVPVRARLRFVPESDWLEPNDEPEDATRVALGSWYEAVLAPGSDADHFRVDAPAAGFIVPELAGGDGDVSPSWGLIDRGGNAISETPPFRVKVGESLIRLRPSSGWSTEPVRFRLRLLPDDDELEPNDESAARVELNREYSVSLPAAEDLDAWPPRSPAMATSSSTPSARRRPST